MKRVRISFQARTQLLAIAKQLDEARAGFGDKLLDEFDLAVNLLSTFPECGAVYYRDVRRILIRKYSCFVLYRVLPRSLSIIKVTDARREPEVIQGELDAT